MFSWRQQARVNSHDDPLALNLVYYPQNILVTNEDQYSAIYDELLTLRPVRRLVE